MKLTNYLRDAFVRAVMQDVPHPDYKKLRTEAQAALVKAMSPAARACFKKAPKALKSDYTYELGERERFEYVIGDIADPEKVLQPYFDQTRARPNLQLELTKIASGCNTLAQLQKMLPELEKYMPSEEAPTRNLPVVANVVANLVKLGWKG